jgi:hypothetical protein
LARYRWKPDFSGEYSRFRSHIDRDYGERAYGDKEKIETSGMLKDAEPDYKMDVKPYRPKKEEEHISWEEKREAEEPKKAERAEVREPMEPEPLGIAEQQEMYKAQLDAETDKLLEQPESNQVEDEFLEIESENIWHPLDELEPGETPDDFISDAEILRKEKLRKLGVSEAQEY